MTDQADADAALARLEALQRGVMDEIVEFRAGDRPTGDAAHDRTVR
ncbi:hypothetical protein [Georgenia sp. Marseille-Q6866]